MLRQKNIRTFHIIKNSTKKLNCQVMRRPIVGYLNYTETEKLMIAELYNRAEELVLTEQQKQALNLLKCIQTYRAYPSVSQLLASRSKLVYQLDDIYKLWRRFDKLSTKDLAELAMELINEIW